MTTGLVAICLLVLAGVGAVGLLRWWRVARVTGREGLYDLLYSLRWGEATTNNYGFAPSAIASANGD